jgi:hypothetical protein
MRTTATAILLCLSCLGALAAEYNVHSKWMPILGAPGVLWRIHEFIGTREVQANWKERNPGYEAVSYKSITLEFWNNSTDLVEFDYVMGDNDKVRFIDLHQPYAGHARIYPGAQTTGASKPFNWQYEIEQHQFWGAESEYEKDQTFLSVANVSPPPDPSTKPVPTSTPESTAAPSSASNQLRWPDGKILAHPEHFINTGVVNVRQGDTLKLRAGPGTRFSVVAEIPSDSSDISAFDLDQVWDGDTYWCPVQWRGLRGYVGRSHLPGAH